MTDPNELQQQGVKLFRQHEYEAASEIFQQAREAYQQANQPDMAAEMQVNIGLVQRALGRHDQALALMREALQIFQEMGDRKREAQVLGNMGGVFAAQRDTEQAMTCYRQAAETFKALGEEEFYGQTLLAIGDLQIKSGHVMAGAAAYEAGLQSLKEVSGPQKILKGLMNVKRRLMGGSSPASLPDDE